MTIIGCDSDGCEHHFTSSGELISAINAPSLRNLYRTLELPGANPLRDAHDELDAAVRVAYGMKPREDPLAFLLAQNHAVASL